MEIRLEISQEPLRSYWTDEKLPDGERFLRDYVLERRYETKDDTAYVTFLLFRVYSPRLQYRLLNNPDMGWLVIEFHLAPDLIVVFCLFGC